MYPTNLNSTKTFTSDTNYKSTSENFYFPDFPSAKNILTKTTKL